MSVAVGVPGTHEWIQTWAVISENREPLGAGWRHSPVIITSHFLLFLSESQTVPVQEAVLGAIALTRETKISLVRKDPGALISCKYP